MSKSGKILIVDDDPLVLEALNQVFFDEYDVIMARSGSEALVAVDAHPDLDAVVLDIRMAEVDGLKTAKGISERNAEVPIIFHTGYPGDYDETDIDREHHPYDYVTKNERPGRLCRSVRNAVDYHRLQTHGDELVALARREYGMVGSSFIMRDIYHTIARIGPTDSKVMILGPTGSGKELVALALHRRSHRSGKRMRILNCNHKAPDLVESELFGHLRGSYTGAVADQVGIVEYANGSTLFLDEVGNLDLNTQGKLLRVIETGQMQRLGSPETIVVDVRVICATNSDLEALVAAEKFREDLYFRLKGITITLPALKDRREDIPELIEYFADRHAEHKKQAPRHLTDDARDLLIAFDWPGNVRQLSDTIGSLIDLSTSELITADDVTRYLSITPSVVSTTDGLSERVREFKRLTIIQALARYGNNVAAAARYLNVDPANLRKMIKELNLPRG